MYLAMKKAAIKTAKGIDASQTHLANMLTSHLKRFFVNFCPEMLMLSRKKMSFLKTAEPRKSSRLTPAHLDADATSQSPSLSRLLAIFTSSSAGTIFPLLRASSMGHRVCPDRPPLFRIEYSPWSTRLLVPGAGAYEERYIDHRAER